MKPRSLFFHLLQCLFLIFALILTSLRVSAQNIPTKKTAPEKDRRVEIITYHDGLVKTPTPSPSQHKHHDVLVYLYVYDKGEYYAVVPYLREKDTLGHLAWGWQPGNEKFDEAYYRWTNDTTVVVRLYNTATKKQKKITISGNSKTSSASTR